MFDRCPGLQVVTGDRDEVVLFYLERIATTGRLAKLQRPIANHVRSNLHVTPSGLFSARYPRWASEVVGVGRILFSSDYPYRFAPGSDARRFLEEAGLTVDERDGITFRDWEALRARRSS